MANETSAVDLADSFTTFTAIAVGDGTYDDVVVQEKIDLVTAVPATGIAKSGGALWFNVMDDFINHTWSNIQGNKLFAKITTTEAGSLFIPLAFLTVDGQASFFDIRVTGTSHDVTTAIGVDRIDKLLVNRVSGTTVQTSISAFSASTPAAPGTMFSFPFVGGDALVVVISAPAALTVDWDISVIAGEELR